MGRSVKKGPFVQPVLLKRVKAMNEAGEKRVLKTWSRSSTIFPDFVGHTFAVHDGCCFSKRMRKVFRKNEKSMLRFCNKNSKKKRAFTTG